MKYKTTAKALKEYGYNVKSAGYCDLQYLLYFTEPTAYTCGIYGWNFDVYHLDGVIITTGYRGMVGNRAEGIREYEEKALAIINNYSIPYEEKRKEIDILLS